MVTQPANCRAGRLARGGHDTCNSQQTTSALLMVAWAACWGFQPMGHTKRLQATADTTCQHGRGCC